MLLALLVSVEEATYKRNFLPHRQDLIHNVKIAYDSVSSIRTHFVQHNLN